MRVRVCGGGVEGDSMPAMGKIVLEEGNCIFSVGKEGAENAGSMRRRRRRRRWRRRRRGGTGVMPQV